MMDVSGQGWLGIDGHEHTVPYDPEATRKANEDYRRQDEAEVALQAKIAEARRKREQAKSS